jgi:hypothetical protein
VLELEAGKLAEHHRRQVAARSDAGRRVVELARMRLGVIDQLLHRLDRRICRHHQDVLGGGHQNDGIEILDRIEAPLRRDSHVDGKRLRTEMQRVPVGGRLRGRGGADIAAGPGPVLHHHRLPQASLSFCEMMRARVSRVPPAENATTIRTERSG